MVTEPAKVNTQETQNVFEVVISYYITIAIWTFPPKVAEELYDY